MQTIRITTSQNIDIDFEIAGVGPRILAYLIDVLMFVLIFLLFVLANLFIGKLASDILVGIGVLVYFILYVFYDLLCEIFMNGQSVGKRVMKIKVISLDGGRPSVSQYTLRWLFRIVDFLLTSNLCALISVAVSEKSQRVGDMVAGTVLIRTEPRAETSDIAYVPTVDERYVPVFTEVLQLNDKDIALLHEVISSYLNSGNSVIVYNTATRLKRVLNIQTDMDDLRFLQTLIKDYNHIIAATATGAI